MLKLFRIIAFLEGTSLLLLLFFAMPMKYYFQEPIYVRSIGMAHGILFVIYFIFAIMLKIEYSIGSSFWYFLCRKKIFKPTLIF
jgi:integral membrane protein